MSKLDAGKLRKSQSKITIIVVIIMLVSVIAGSVLIIVGDSNDPLSQEELETRRNELKEQIDPLVKQQSKEQDSGKLDELSAQLRPLQKEQADIIGRLQSVINYNSIGIAIIVFGILVGVLVKLINKSSQLLMPMMILVLLLFVNLLVGPGFFNIKPGLDNYKNTVFKGDLISIINGASELVLMAIGMTIVTSASGGQDISVGATAAISGSIFVKIMSSGNASILSILFAFLISCIVVMLCSAFSGTLVAVFKIQPMIATLILFTAGRSIAYGINGAASPKLYDDLTRQIGSFISGVPIQTPIFIVAIFICLFLLLFKYTNLRLYTESVGINEKSSRLNGINPIAIKILAFVILGFCVAAAGVISSCRLQRVDHLNILAGIEMDAILAVAIGGNALGGGKFSIAGSVIGAYAIETLTKTLIRMQVVPEAIKIYKAGFIVLLMVASSPVVKEYALKLWGYLRKLPGKKTVPAKEAA